MDSVLADYNGFQQVIRVIWQLGNNCLDRGLDQSQLLDRLAQDPKISSSSPCHTEIPQ